MWVFLTVGNGQSIITQRIILSITHEYHGANIPIEIYWKLQTWEWTERIKRLALLTIGNDQMFATERIILNNKIQILY